MAFNQGTNLLGLRNKRRKEVLGNHKILEGFDNPPDTPQSYSSCGADSGKPRYGWCPPTPSDLLYEKDDDVSARQAEVDKLYGLMSQYGTYYQNYMENVQNYITNPPSGLEGKNIYVPQLDGPAASCPSCLPPCPAGWWRTDGGTGSCVQTCPSDAQTRNADGRCKCKLGGDNESCIAGTHCVNNECVDGDPPPPPPAFWPLTGNRYPYHSQGDALAGCKAAGYDRLCTMAEVTSMGGKCAAGYVADGSPDPAGYYCPDGACGYPQGGCGPVEGGWRGWNPESPAGAYCCNGTAPPPPTCKNMDGRYDYGDPKRYTGGWALTGTSSASECANVCSSQPECKVSGQTCKPTWYSDGDRCYCSFCVPSGTATPPPPPPSKCWFQITGQCAGYPDMSNKAWFKDDEYGGAPFSPDASQAKCDARKKSWEQSCGPNAAVSEWYGSGNPPADADKPNFGPCGCAAVVPPDGAITGQSSLLQRGFPAANLTAGNRYCWTSDWKTPEAAITECKAANGCMVVGDTSKGWQGGCITKGPPR